MLIDCAAIHALEKAPAIVPSCYRAISFVLALVYWRWWECYIRCQVARHRAIGRVGVQSGRLASRQQVSAIVPCIVLSGSY